MQQMLRSHQKRTEWAVSDNCGQLDHAVATICDSKLAGKKLLLHNISGVDAICSLFY